MKRVYKYTLNANETETILQMPKDAELLSVDYNATVGTRTKKIYLWANVDTEKELVKRTIRVVATGEDIHKEDEFAIFIGTFKVLSASVGFLMYHVFELFTVKGVPAVAEVKETEQEIL